MKKTIIMDGIPFRDIAYHKANLKRQGVSNIKIRPSEKHKNEFVIEFTLE